MRPPLQKMNSDSLKERFVREMEGRILSGYWNPGDRLPPERELASQLGISRSIVNNGILELASKGFVRMQPRKGTFVEDYQREGTSQVLTAVMQYDQERFEPHLFHGMMDTRMLIEGESARCAAIHRSEADLKGLRELLADIRRQPDPSPAEYEAFNFNFHHRITIASGNMVFAMILKSFEPVCRNLIRRYYEHGPLSEKTKTLRAYDRLYQAVEDRKPEEAAQVMLDILGHGRNELGVILYGKGEETT